MAGAGGSLPSARFASPMTQPATPGAPPAASNDSIPVRPREIFGWCCFDFANSAFTTVIITVVYAAYFFEVVAGKDPRATGWWGTVLSFSQFVVILISPLIGAVADATGRKKSFLMVTAVVCSLGTMALFFVGAGEIWLSLALVCFANIAFSLSENLCAAFLPEISTPATAGRISGYGWSFGYFGGLLSLVLALVIIKSGSGRVPWTFVMTGGFFILASLPTLLLLRERAVRRALPSGRSYLSIGLAQIRQMIREVPQHRTLAIFFLAMTLYISGLTAVIAYAAIYAGEVVHMTQEQIIMLFIVLQLAGVAGAFGFGFLQDRVGAKPALMLALVLWIIACLWAGFCQSAGEFIAVGVVAGLALGSLQSASRAVVSTLTPVDRAGEFFGYWGFFGKLAGVIGPFVFGWLATWLGFRVAIMVNTGFFLAGLMVLIGLRLEPTTAER